MDHRNSELRKEKYDFASFWGSWEAAGNNFAIGGEWAEFRAIDDLRREDSSFNSDKMWNDPAMKRRFESRIAKNKIEILRTIYRHFIRKGGALFVSPRYARHGGGYTTDLLPVEKRGQFRLVQQLRDVGFKEFLLLGLSKDAVWKALTPHQDFRKFAVELEDEDALCRHKESYETEVFPLEVDIGRIDAIYARK